MPYRIPRPDLLLYLAPIFISIYNLNLKKEKDFKACISSNNAATVLLALGICDPDSKAYSVWVKILWKAYRQTPLWVALENSHEAVAQLLLDKGANLELLLDKGADLEAKDKYGWTPLGQAVASGHEAVARLLLDKGADLEAKGQSG
ncbi:ankyrin [Thozetella sp. PMI_491]|nr:ankyrin [Thozetella sp. PMI_491]